MKVTVSPSFLVLGWQEHGVSRQGGLGSEGRGAFKLWTPRPLSGLAAVQGADQWDHQLQSQVPVGAEGPGVKWSARGHNCSQQSPLLPCGLPSSASPQDCRTGYNTVTVSDAPSSE